MEEVIRKLKFRGVATVLNGPENLAADFEKIGCNYSMTPGVKCSNLLVFIRDKSAFEGFLNTDLAKVEYDTVLWFAYPKGTSGVKTDVNRDILWAIARQNNLDAVGAVAIDNVWSAIRLRPIERVGK